MKYAPRKVYIKENGGYVELSYTDFCRRRESDQTYMDKLFIPIQGCLLEVVREQYTDFYRDKERWRYLQKLDTKNSLLSLDGFTDSEGNPLDFIADEAADIAETVVNTVMVDRLKAALSLLSDSEQVLIRAIFFEELSEREVGLRLGITQSVVNKRKARILTKLRKVNGWSQEDLAEKLSVSRQAISRWENGTALPDANNILQLSKLFNVTTDYLLNEDYSSDSDIPCVKEVHSILDSKKLLYRKRFLIASILWLLSAAVWLIQAINWLDVIYCVLAVANAIVSLINIILYEKNKKTEDK